MIEKVSPFPDPEEVARRHAATARAWDEGSERYRLQLGEVEASIRRGEVSTHAIEQANLGTLGPLADWCELAVHPQCAGGRDTLSLWQAGAHRVAGIDSSAGMIACARELAARVEAPATFYHGDVLTPPDELHGQADLVYTGQGALCWIQDLAAWAHAMAMMLKPGGWLHLLDGHPIQWLLEEKDGKLVYVDFDYFTHAEVNRGWGPTYIGDVIRKPAEAFAEKYEHQWPIGTVFTVLRAAGLVVEHLQEHPEDFWQRWEHVPAEAYRKVPNTFSVMARKPT